jgi:dihydrofolate reductase
MRRVTIFNMVTLDGYFEGPNHGIDWHNVDGEFNEFAIDQLNSAGGLVFGRVTYQLMASYWPTPDALKDDPAVANLMNQVPKIVFSRTLDKAEWSNTTLVKGDAGQEIAKLKQQPGNDLYVFGSANLTSTLMRLGLIDEYRVIVNPIVLGRGTPMFQNVQTPFKLKLVNARTFHSGNILLYYAPEK